MLLVLPVLALLMVVSLSAPAPAASAAVEGEPVVAAASSAAVSPAVAASLAAEAQAEPDGGAALALLERVGAVDFEPGEKLINGGVIDSEGTYAYYSTFTRPCRVAKVDAKTFEFVDAISLDPGGGRCQGEFAVIDPEDAYAYFSASNGWLFKIDLATFEPVDALQVNSANFSDGARGLMDPQGRFAYFTQGLSIGGVVKIDLETFTWVGTVLQGFETTAAVIDPEGRYAYIGTEDRPAKIFKVDLETFEPVDDITLDLENGENCLYAAAIDSEGRYAYFGTRFNYGVNKSARVIKIDLETFERVDALPLNRERGSGSVDDDLAESSLYAAVIDPTDTYAYFMGRGSGWPGQRPGRVIKIDLGTFERVGAIEIDVMDNDSAVAPVMDPDGAFMHLGVYAQTRSGAHVAKIDLASFEWVDTIRGTLPEGLLGTAVVDPGGDYAYFGTGSRAPSQVVKVNLDTFERVGSVALEDPEGTLNTEEFDKDRVGGLASGVIDPQGTYGYFGSNLSRGQVAKVNLETLELVDYIWLEEGEGSVEAAVIDPEGRYAYFGSNGEDHARVVKIDLATFERVDALPLLNGQYADAAVIDPAGAYAYFLGGWSSNTLVKIDLKTFKQVGAITFVGTVIGDIGLTRSIVIDPDGAFAYVGATSSNKGRNVAKVDLKRFLWVDTLQLDVDHDEFMADSAVMDPNGRFAVFGAGSSGSTNTPGVLVRVDLETFEQAETLVLEREFEETFLGGGGAAGALAAVIDPRGVFAYFGMWSTPGRVVKVRVDGQAGAVDALAFTGASAISGVRGATVELSARLAHADRAPAPGQVLTFSMAGFQAQASTNAKGVASVEMPVEASYGRHELTVGFAGDQGKGLPPAQTKVLFYTLWEHTFADGNPRVKVNTITNELQFAARGDVSGIKHDPNMKVETLPTGEKVIRINYTDLDLTVVGEFFPDSGRFAATVLTPTGPYVLKGTG